MSTVAEVVESTLGYALEAAAHARARERTFHGKNHETPALKLIRSGHWWARIWHEGAADTAWACVGHATVPATGPEPLPEYAP